MAVKLRLARRGRKQNPFYHIVVADARAPRDGKFIEQIGSYNPMTKPATIDLDRDKAYSWLEKGAQPTETVRAILRFKGVLYRKHLQRGVIKGAMSQEAADELYNAYISEKEARVDARKAQTVQERIDFHKQVFGAPVKAQKVVETATEALAEFNEAAASSEEE
jgi:small subunit ribosomal protein S16